MSTQQSLQERSFQSTLRFWCKAQSCASTTHVLAILQHNAQANTEGDTVEPGSVKKQAGPRLSLCALRTLPDTRSVTVSWADLQDQLIPNRIYLNQQVTCE